MSHSFDLAVGQRVRVYPSSSDERFRVIVEDFGDCGEHPTGDEGAGYGLTGMSERAELLGGTLTAGPTDGGFRVELRVPA